MTEKHRKNRRKIIVNRRLDIPSSNRPQRGILHFECGPSSVSCVHYQFTLIDESLEIIFFEVVPSLGAQEDE